MVKINLKKAIKALFIYETPKLVEIENWKIGLTQRVLQVIIAIYVVCWVLIYEKGYQVNDDGMTSVTTKVLYTPTWTAHLRGLCALLIDTAVEVLLLIWSLLTAMYSVVQFVCDDSVAVAAKSWFVGDQLVAWPRDREMQRLLEANRRPTDGAKLYEVKVLKDGLDLGKARRLARKAEDTDNLSSSEPAALGRGMRTKYPRILTSDSEDENDIDDLQGNTRGRLGPWPVPPAALRQPNENLPPERQLLQEIKQELMSLRKKVDFLSEKAILSDSNFKDMKAMLADTRRALQTVSFVSKEKPPVIQLPLRTSEDYDEFVSKVGTDREIFEETMQYVTTVSIAAAIRKLSGKQRLNGSTEPEIDTEGEQNAAGLLTWVLWKVHLVAMIIQYPYRKTRSQPWTIITAYQILDYSERGSACSSDNDCVKLTSSASEIGVRTGKCLSLPTRTGVCEIYAWCPLENDTHVPKNGQKTLNFIRNYTVYIKNDIEFPKFKVKRNNRDSWVSNASIGSCRYDPNHPIDKYCPIFKMSTIFDQTGVDTNTIFKGGVLGIIINWECDLDHGIKNCNPQYSFTNLEDTREKSSGFNFRYAIYYREGGVLYRDLIKAFGIRFSIFVHATAGKFNIIPLFLNLGSGLALLGLAPTVCDIIILNLVGTRRLYKRAKFEVVKTTHASEKEVSEKCTNLQEDHQWNTSVQSKYDERLNRMPYIEQE
ncbi:Receptor for ATP that acts as a ligand-gated ion channel [Sparganum proliferum]